MESVLNKYGYNKWYIIMLVKIYVNVYIYIINCYSSVIK